MAQPSLLPGPAVPGGSLVSFYFLWAILCTQAVHRRRTSDINVEIEGEAHINEKAAPHPLNDLAQENSEINLLKYQAELFHRHGRVDEEEDVKTMVRILSE